MHRELRFIANAHGYILKREHAACVTIMANYASHNVLHFVQNSTEGSQTFEAKHKLELFVKNCGVNIGHYHVDNKIFNEKIFRESCMLSN